MLTIPATVAIYLHTRPTDMRKGIDGLSGLVRDEFGGDPLGVVPATPRKGRRRRG